MKDLLQKLKTLTTSHHGELGFQSRQFEDLKAFIEENQWYTLEEKTPPMDGTLFLVNHDDFDGATACRCNGRYFETMQYDAVVNYQLTAAEIVKWRKFPTT